MPAKAGGLALLLVCTPAAAQVPQFPIRDAQSAIAIGKYICSRTVGPSLEWEAQLDKDKQVWDVSTMPSLRKKTTTQLWVVFVPVDGPYPTACRQSFYSLIEILPKKSN